MHPWYVKSNLKGNTHLYRMQCVWRICSIGFSSLDFAMVKGVRSANMCYSKPWEVRVDLAQAACKMLYVVWKKNNFTITSLERPGVDFLTSARSICLNQSISVGITRTSFWVSAVTLDWILGLFALYPWIGNWIFWIRFQGLYSGGIILCCGWLPALQGCPFRFLDQLNVK